MLASEIREMTASDIQTRITELQEERFRLRFRGATEQLEEPLRLRAIRRDVARLKTVLRQREMGEVATAPSATTKKAAKKAPAKKRTAKKAASAGK
jgi:large subunit ribosomal protein L29